MTKPIYQVIPRKIPDEIVPTISHSKEMIEDLVNFGSHILKWDLDIKDPNRKDESVPPIMMYRHFLDTLDSIGLLIEQGCGDTGKILLRALFETFLGLIYLCEKDSEQRAMAYMTNDVLSQIKTLQRMNPEAIEGKELNSILIREINMSTVQHAKQFNLSQNILDKEAILSLPAYQPSYQEYLRMKKNKIKNPAWYQYFDGPRNIQSLAIYLKYQSLYELCYRSWSGMVHGSDVYLGKITSDTSSGQVELVQLRYFRDVQQIATYAQIFTFTVFRNYIQARIPSKFKQFQQWYKAHRDHFK